MAQPAFAQRKDYPPAAEAGGTPAALMRFSRRYDFRRAIVTTAGPSVDRGPDLRICCTTYCPHATVGSGFATMKRTPPKIVFVSRRGLSGAFASHLQRSGYVISRTERALKTSERLRPEKYKALVSEGLTAQELRGLLVPAQRGTSRDRSAVFTAELTPSGRPGRKDRSAMTTPKAPPVIPMTLRALRASMARTQGEMARRMAMTQPQLSRVEARRDHLISTLRKYVRALGGRIEVAALVDGTRIVLQDV